MFSGGAHFECEVGDLSGKDGPITVSSDGDATQIRTTADPLAAVETQFIGELVVAAADKFGSIVFHNGSPRVLCGKLFEGTPPEGSTFAITSSGVATSLSIIWAVVMIAFLQW